MSAKETKVNKFLHEWGGTTHGLNSEWVSGSQTSTLARPLCKRCGKYRCCHQIYSGKVSGQTGRTVETKDPKKILNFSEFHDFELQNFSPRNEELDILLGVNTAVKSQLGFGLSEFKDLVPVYSNINNTHVNDISNISKARRSFQQSKMTGKTSESNLAFIRKAL